MNILEQSGSKEKDWKPNANKVHSHPMGFVQI